MELYLSRIIDLIKTLIYEVHGNLPPLSETLSSFYLLSRKVYINE